MSRLLQCVIAVSIMAACMVLHESVDQAALKLVSLYGAVVFFTITVLSAAI